MKRTITKGDLFTCAVSGVAILVLGVLLTACGSSPSPQPASTSIDACSLVTQTEAGQILHGTVQVKSDITKQGKPDEASTCTYTPASGTGHALITVEHGSAVKGYYDAAQGAYQNVSGAMMMGIGDKAFHDELALHVLKGDVLLNISVFSDDPTQVLSQEEQFAKDAVARL